MKKKDEIIKVEAELNLSTGVIRVRSLLKNEWGDLGPWLEVTGFMAYQAMLYREWSEKKMVEYVSQYITKCLRNYKTLPGHMGIEKV